MNRPINLALIGVGTVGTGVLALLHDNCAELARRTGRKLCITHVATRRVRDDLPKHIEQSSDVLAVASSPEVDIVIEVMGGTTLAKEVVLTAIRHGKHVVTANKALLAAHGNAIFAEAEAAGVHVAYEAAVAGGIPIIKVLREALAGNQVNWLAGIINGTSNFIMTRMANDQCSFADALTEAQRLGYAEADPAFDIEGTDAAHKLALLSAIAFGIPVQFDKVYVEGITGIALQDILYAKALGYTIKHLGLAVRGTNGLELRVHPTLIPSDSLLANVNGVKNGVMVSAHPLGETLYYGDGAGAGATASAVMADVIDLARLISTDSDSHYVPHLAFVPEALADTQILPPSATHTGYYLRLTVANVIGVLASVTEILRDNTISIDAILQKPHQDADNVSIIELIQPTLEQYVNSAISHIEQLAVVKEPIIRLRLENLST